MRILVSNDDGYLARGIRVLMQALEAVAEVEVIAPDRNRSGASQSLTLVRPLRIHRHHDGVVSVDGTPTDCVNLGVNGLCEKAPHMVVSGINDGPNMGDDVIYSGTVAAAIEGRHLGYPAIAVSMGTSRPKHYETAARVAVELIQRLEIRPLPIDTILNVNVPDLPYEALKGWRATRLGNRHQSGATVVDADPRGLPIYWIGPPGDIADAGEGSDFCAVAEGYVSITPLQIDLTRHSQLKALQSWLGEEEA